MTLSRGLLTFLIPALLQTGAAFAQTGADSLGVQCRERLRISPPDSVLQLSEEFIVHGSETVRLDTVELVRGVDYEFEYRHGRLVLAPDFWERRAGQLAEIELEIAYRAISLPFRDSYVLREVRPVTDSSLGALPILARSEPALTVDDFLGKGLRKSGSLLRGFTVGSNQDLGLNAGFRMQLEGSLAEDVAVVASLTDLNTPIQPEGSTQTLREVDNVFVAITTPVVGATLGDFQVVIDGKQGGEFGRLTRKLQGAQGVVHSENIGSSGSAGSLSLTGASPKGSYASNFFQGLEGNQGPYQLTGVNGERLIIVIAGSERVFVNGIAMVRGETNDYVIDYSSAEITFTPRRLITSASRITVDFEYSDERYERTFVSGTANVALSNDVVSLNMVFAQEGDNKDRPINQQLGAAERAILESSGADRLKASVPGATYVGIDSATGKGKGQYRLTDTTVAEGLFPIYVYAPGDTDATYSVTFSTVVPMPADSFGYRRVSIGHFEPAGVGQGEYLPIRLLALPERKRLADFSGRAAITNNIQVFGEFAVSDFDRNQFSSLDDSSRQDKAFSFGARYSEQELRLGSLALGALELSVRERYVGRDFNSLDRFNEIEFDRNWNIENSDLGDEEIREAALSYSPVAPLSFKGSYGVLDRSGQVKSTRWSGEAGFRHGENDALTYRAEFLTTSEIPQQSSSEWLRQSARGNWTIGHLQPGLRVDAEERTEKAADVDSLRRGSFRYLEIAPKLDLVDFWKMSLGAEFQLRTEDSASQGSLARASEALTQGYFWRLSEWNDLTAAVTLSVKRTTFTEQFRLRGNQDTDVMLIRFDSRYIPFERAVQLDTYYEFANEQSAPLERVFVRVQQGTGNYRYLGDLNGNALADEDEFEQTRFDGEYVAVFVPGQTLVPTVDLKTSARLRLQPARVVKGQTPFASALRSLSSETYVRLEESGTGKDPKDVYLLKIQTFQDSATTISGDAQFLQDLFLFEGKKDLSARFRYSERSGMVQFVSGPERARQSERSLRVRSQLIAEIGNITELSNLHDQVTASGGSAKSRDLVSNLLSSDFSYRPTREWEVGFRVSVGRTSDSYGGDDASNSSNDQNLRLTYSFFGRGQLRAELTREEVTLDDPYSDPTKTIPYEFTRGKSFGTSLLWRGAVDYRINANIQLTLDYTGRREASSPVVHTLQANAQAFF